jgi:hypothetical protein
MQRIFLLLVILVIVATGFSCGGSQNASGDTPSEAYKKLFAAVKSKDTEAIKKQVTKKTIELGKMSMERFKKTEAQAFENGFTETTFSDALPSIRDERVKDNMGSVEVWNSKSRRWEDLPFMYEDGAWKLAVGEMFSGTFKSPGKGRDQLEKEAANAFANNAAPPLSNINSNTVMVANVPGANKKPK